MRAVLDTNVVISGLLTRKGPPSRIVDAWVDGCFEALISPTIASEYFEVLSRPKFSSVGSIDERTRLLTGLISLPWTVLVVAAPLPITGPGATAPCDASDVRFLECAAAGGADFVVTGDKHLLELPAQRGFTAVSPAAFSEMISR